MRFAEELGAHRPGIRNWRRTDEHPVHLGCWRGEPTGTGSTAVVCMEAGVRPTRIVVGARHAGSGKAIRRAARVGFLRSWGSTVRSAMNAVG
jgi:hypothetical protein